MMIIILLHDMTGEMGVVLPGIVGAKDLPIAIPGGAAEVVLLVIKAAILPVTGVHQAVAAMLALRILAVAAIQMDHQGIHHEAIPADPHPVIPIGLPGDQHLEEINHPGKRNCNTGDEAGRFCSLSFEYLKILL